MGHRVGSPKNPPFAVPGLTVLWSRLKLRAMLLNAFIRVVVLSTVLFWAVQPRCIGGLMAAEATEVSVLDDLEIQEWDGPFLEVGSNDSTILPAGLASPTGAPLRRGEFLGGRSPFRGCSEAQGTTSVVVRRRCSYLTDPQIGPTAGTLRLPGLIASSVRRAGRDRWLRDPGLNK